MQRRCVIAMANAVDSPTPRAINAAERLASAAPIPPGDGIRLESTEAGGSGETLWTMTCKSALVGARAVDRAMWLCEGGLGLVLPRGCARHQ